MKKITIYALEGCGQCKKISDHLQSTISGKDIELSKKFCGPNDTGCDALEDGLGTEKYPIVLIQNFEYFKEKFNKTNGILYLCKEFDDTLIPVAFNSDTVGIGVLTKDDMLNKLNKIVK